MLRLSGLTAEAAGEALSGLAAEAAAGELSGLSGLLALLTAGALPLLALTLTLTASLTLALSGLTLSGGSLGKDHSHCQSERCRQTDKS